MKRISMLLGCFLLLVVAGCAQRQHFGVADRALWVPPQFDQTEEAIARAEKSEGARYCPEKIVKANQLGKEAAELYWSCRTEKALGILAEARNLAKEAESCQAPPLPLPPPSPPARVAAPPPPPPPPPPRLESISLKSLNNFEFDKSDLSATAMVELDRVAEIMRNNPDLVLELQGNTDSIGTEAYNMGLGQRRAQAVFGYLKSKGIDSNRFKLVSHGENNPVATNATRTGRAKNRRVDLVVIK